MRQKHVPSRTCVGCGQVRPKRQMVRVVRALTGAVEVDPTGKRAGRGAYLCENADCWEKALQKSSLARALKTEVTAEDKETLLRHGRLFGVQAITQPAPVAEGETSS